MWKREVLIQSGTPIHQSNTRELALTLGDWSEGGTCSLTLRLLALTLCLGVFHVGGFTGVVVVFTQEGQTVGGKEASGIVLGVFFSRSLGENCLRW